MKLFFDMLMFGTLFMMFMVVMLIMNSSDDNYVFSDKCMCDDIVCKEIIVKDCHMGTEMEYCDLYCDIDDMEGLE